MAADLRYHLDLLDRAGDEYRALFLEGRQRVPGPRARRRCRGLPALERLKWELVRRRALPELLEMLRFQREETLRTPPCAGSAAATATTRSAATRGCGLPRSAFRLGRRDPELALTARLEDLRFEDGALRLFGHAYVTALGAGGPESQRVSIAAVRPGRLRALRMRVASRRFPTRPERRPTSSRDLGWSGFRTAIRPAEVATGRRGALGRVRLREQRRRCAGAGRASRSTAR